MVRDRLSTAEYVLRHCGSGHSFVGVMNVVDVCDICNVRNIRHIPHVGTAVVIPREEWLSRPEWEPAHQSDSDTKRKSWPSEKGNESRRINRHREERSGQPSPGRPDQYPASVVEWAESPGLIIHPSPTPRINPHPVAEAVRHPADSDRREPDWSIFLDHSPMPVIVQVIKTRSQRVHILRGF